jgi:hypothetical protein
MSVDVQFYWNAMEQAALAPVPVVRYYIQIDYWIGLIVFTESDCTNHCITSAIHYHLGDTLHG